MASADLFLFLHDDVFMQVIQLLHFRFFGKAYANAKDATYAIRGIVFVPIVENIVMKSIKVKIMVIVFALYTSILMAQSNPSSDPNTRRNTTEPADAHNPFPSKQGMNTPDTLFRPADGKNKAAINKVITTKHAKIPSQGNGSDILNDRRDTTEKLEEMH